MNRKQRPYPDFYDSDTDRYDLDAYAADIGLNQPGTHTPQYVADANFAIAFMELYNDEAGHADEARAAHWRSVLSQVEGAVYALLAMGALIVAMI